MRSAPVLVFDVDGTLMDTKEGYLRSHRDVMTELGIGGVSDNEILRLISLDLRSIFEELFGNGNRPELTFDDYCAFLFAKNEENNALIKPMPCALDMLDSLRNMYRIAICTNGSNESLERFWYFFNRFKEDFALVVTRDVVNEGKPNAEGLIKIAAHCQCSPADLLMIGDSGIDAEAAMNAGSTAILIGTVSDIRSQIVEKLGGRISFFDDLIELKGYLL